MRHLKPFAPMVSLACLLACAVPAVSARGAEVRLMKADPAADCQEVGQVEGFFNGDGKEKSSEGAKAILRNKAAERGANYVRLETTNAEGTNWAGTAFKCPAGH